jgi:hypothetical protein
MEGFNQRIYINKYISKLGTTPTNTTRERDPSQFDEIFGMTFSRKSNQPKRVGLSFPPGINEKD